MLASIICCAVGVSLWRTRGIKWFFATQILCLLGQGASAGARDYQGFISNLFEQVLAWSLLALWLRLPTGALTQEADHKVRLGGPGA